MKSILALLCIVAVANAYIDKDGGLKGSWADTIMVTRTGAADLDAPGVIAHATGAILESYSSGFGTAYIMDRTVDPDNEYIYFYFDITNEMDNSAGDTNYDMDWFQDEMPSCIAVSFMNADLVHSIPFSCDISGANYVTCSAYIRDNMVTGAYTPMITLMDPLGNWATYTVAAFTGADVPVWTYTDIADNADVTAPVVTGSDISLAIVPLDATGTYTFWTTTGASTIISVDVHDSPTTDTKSTGIRDVWVEVDVDGAGMGDNMMFPLWEEEDVVETPDIGNVRYSVELSFTPVFRAGVWTIVKFIAYDEAGNKGELALTAANTITVTDALLIAASDADDGVFSCQTIDAFGDVSGLTPAAPATTQTARAYAYLEATCVLKSASTIDNYVGVGYQSPAYNAEGWAGATYTVWSEGTASRWNTWDLLGYDVGYTYGDEDSDTDVWYAAGTETDSTGAWDEYIYFPPRSPTGGWSLFEVYTINKFGGIQTYRLALGSASSVAPSLFAVAIAAVVALFHL